MKKIYLIIPAILFMQARAITECGDHETHTQLYNSLQTVEAADMQLKASANFDQFINEFKALATNHQLEEVIGLRLIHKHFILPDSQHIMLETFEQNDGPAFVTKAVSLADVKTEAMPASWIISGQQLVPFEFSNDAAVKSGRENIFANQEFLSQATDLIKTYNLESLISLAIAKRANLLSDNAEDQYLEITTAIGNVVRACSNIEMDSAIQTLWATKHTCGCRSGYCGGLTHTHDPT